MGYNLKWQKSRHQRKISTFFCVNKMLNISQFRGINKVRFSGVYGWHSFCQVHKASQQGRDNSVQQKCADIHEKWLLLLIMQNCRSKVRYLFIYLTSNYLTIYHVVYWSTSSTTIYEVYLYYGMRSKFLEMFHIWFPPLSRHRNIKNIKGEKNGGTLVITQVRFNKVAIMTE